jgi:hypothetical protein
LKMFSIAHHMQKKDFSADKGRKNLGWGSDKMRSRMLAFLLIFMIMPCAVSYGHERCPEIAVFPSPSPSPSPSVAQAAPSPTPSPEPPPSHLPASPAGAQTSEPATTPTDLDLCKKVEQVLRKQAKGEEEGEERLMLNLTATYVSRYMWRGEDLNDGHPMLEPTAEFVFGKSGYSLTIQGYYGLQGSDINNEIDYILKYDFAVNRHFSMNLNVAYYNYLYKPESYAEAWATLVWEDGPLKPAFSYYKELRPEGTDYYNIQLSKEIKCGQILFTLGLSAGCQYGSRVTSPGFTDLEINLSTDWIVRDKFSLNTKLAYNLVPNNPTVSTNNILWYSINAKFSW